jgi:hypothetical protein
MSFSTLSVPQAVEKATSELLLLPDYDTMMLVRGPGFFLPCPRARRARPARPPPTRAPALRPPQLSDYASLNAGNAAAVFAALRGRLSCAGSAAASARRLGPNPKVASLALACADCALKNGSSATLAAAGAPDWLAAVLALARGGGAAAGDSPGAAEARSAAAALLQSLGLAYAEDASLPFAAALASLRAEGAPLPPPDLAAAAALREARAKAPPVPAPRAAPAPARAPAPAPARRAAAAADFADAAASVAALDAALARVRGELGAVRARVAAAARLLVDGAGAAPGAAPLLDAVDFLQQCVPRLAALVEACVAGVLADEAFFDAVLSVHEAVARVLEVAAPIAAAPPGSRAPAAAPQLADLVDFDAGGGAPQQPLPPRARAAASESKSGRERDAAAAARRAAADDDMAGLFAPRSPQPAPAAGTAAAAAAAALAGLTLGGVASPAPSGFAPQHPRGLHAPPTVLARAASDDGGDGNPVAMPPPPPPPMAEQQAAAAAARRRAAAAASPQQQSVFRELDDLLS